jgi:hypothetical protein
MSKASTATKADVKTFNFVPIKAVKIYDPINIAGKVSQYWNIEKSSVPNLKVLADFDLKLVKIWVEGREPLLIPFTNTAFIVPLVD